MKIILGSRSPRRRELLAKLGLEFRILTADVDEAMDLTADPAAEVARISAKKAAAILPLAGEEELVVCADTIVVLDDRIMGKPADAAEAARMLRALSGRTHRVLTGVTIHSARGQKTVVETTEVTFRPLREAEIAAYIATGEPMDKAGAYGIQGTAGLFVSGIRGDYFNVMGLPLCTVTLLLRSFGVPVLGTPEA